MDDPPAEERPYLTIATRTIWEDGGAAKLTPASCKTLAAENNTSVRERSLRVLGRFADRSTGPGSTVAVDLQNDYPLFGTTSSQELISYIEYLFSRNALAHDQNNTYRIKVEGWQQLEPVKRKGGTPGTCFVAMAFDPSLDNAYEQGIITAVMDCGFTPIRIDRVPHNEQITDRIMAGIRDCQFMIADFTLQRNGVYYEAGFARGLGRPVVHCCREDQIKDLHFDTKIISHVPWTEAADLRTKLRDHIKATIIDQE